MTRRSRIASLIAAVSVLFLAAGFVYLRGGSTPVPVDSAVDRFRLRTQSLVPVPNETTTPRPTETTAAGVVRPPDPSGAATEEARPRGVRPRPAEGVYVYATTGGDEVDVLGGSRHTYPDETTITVRHDGCGLVERWDALEERWDERESCRTDAGDALRRTTSHHEFFGRADTRTLRCDGLTYPASARPGDSWPMTCASENTTAHLRLEAVGWEDIEISGQAVRTLHVRVRTRITGEQEGTGTRDVWGSVDTGLAVRERSTLTTYSNQPVFGRTRYHESYEIRLLSLEPRR